MSSGTVQLKVPRGFKGFVYIYEDALKGIAPYRPGNLEISCGVGGKAFIRIFDDWPETFQGRVIEEDGTVIPLVDGKDDLSARAGDRFAYGLGEMGVFSGGNV